MELEVWEDSKNGKCGLSFSCQLKIDALVQSCQLACSRHSDSRAQRSDGGERIESYAGKTRGEMRQDWSVFRLHSTF